MHHRLCPILISPPPPASVPDLQRCRENGGGGPSSQVSGGRGESRRRNVIRKVAEFCRAPAQHTSPPLQTRVKEANEATRIAAEVCFQDASGLSNIPHTTLDAYNSAQVLRASREEVRSIKAVVQSLKKAAGGSPNEASGAASCVVQTKARLTIFTPCLCRKLRVCSKKSEPRRVLDTISSKNKRRIEIHGLLSMFFSVSSLSRHTSR